jgi:hypothetical protein
MVDSSEYLSIRKIAPALRGCSGKGYFFGPICFNGPIMQGKQDLTVVMLYHASGNCNCNCNPLIPLLGDP